MLYGTIKLEEYWIIIEKSTTLPTLLDPRSKLKTFVTCEARSAAIDMLRQHMSRYGEANTSTIIQKKENQEKTNQRLFFELLLQQENDVPMVNELERYLALPLAPEGNLLKWWYKFEKEFPTLSKMAKSYLRYWCPK